MKYVPKKGLEVQILCSPIHTIEPIVLHNSDKYLHIFAFFFFPKRGWFGFLNFKHCSPILFPSIICM